MRVLRQLQYIFLSAVVLSVFTACDPEVKAVSGMNVVIDINPVASSSGFIRCIFTPNKDAYYHIGIIPVSEAPDVTNNAAVRTFMSLMLDKTYADYIYWRYDLLVNGSPYVAGFPTHSLQYGETDKMFTLLKPGTDYMIYAFVVDAKTNKPDGRLFTYNMSTTEKSLCKDTKFEYRVKGMWDYIYPVDGESGIVLTYVPWAGKTIDSLQMYDTGYYAGYVSPRAYFMSEFNDYMEYQENDRLHLGIYAHNNDGVGDGTSETLFEEGHTYYTAITVMDGYFEDNAMVIYKFRWEGEKTSLLFKHPQRLTTDW